MVLHLFTKRLEAEMELIQCGWEDCSPGHDFGPAERGFYLIHFVKSGKGIFRAEKQTHELGPGQGFLICPGQLTYYKADETDPWSYVWIGFHGYMAEALLKRADLTTASPVFADNASHELSACFDELIGAMERPAGDLFAAASFYRLLAVLADGNAQPGRDKSSAGICADAKEMMRGNVSEPISISNVAAAVGLSRCYFSQLFKSQAGVSPQSFLIELRLDMAKDMLAGTVLPVGQVAASVGYDNPFMFSRIFKKRVGLSPTEFRKINRRDIAP